MLCLGLLWKEGLGSEHLTCRLARNPPNHQSLSSVWHAYPHPHPHPLCWARCSQVYSHSGPSIFSGWLSRRWAEPIWTGKTTKRRGSGGLTVHLHLLSASLRKFCQLLWLCRVPWRESLASRGLPTCSVRSQLLQVCQAGSTCSLVHYQV